MYPWPGSPTPTALGAIAALAAAACHPSTPAPAPLPPGILRTSPHELAATALARGDSQYLFLKLSHGNVLACRDLATGLELNPHRDVRWLTPADLSLPASPSASAKDSVLNFLDAYNRDMLGARMRAAICGTGAPDSTVDSLCRAAS
jgi:hypothetical protein